MPERTRRRARDAGIHTGNGTPGRYNAITDVAGVRAGQHTLIQDDPATVRTGVTVILPHDGNVFTEPLYAGFHWLNGNGELTGTAWIRENGKLMSPIGITNTGSVGIVRDTFTALETATHGPGHLIDTLPVVGETWDGALNDINGRHIRPEHVRQAYRDAAGGPVAEGNTGGGTGMICHGFKGGTGTASRVLDEDDGGWTVGVLVQANHGVRERLTILGVPVGEEITGEVVPEPDPPEPTYTPGAGSIIGIVATDAPLLPHQCERLARRGTLGVARTGGAGEDSSGDGFLAFSTANRDTLAAGAQTGRSTPEVLHDDYIDPLFWAVIEATEEAILNAMLMAGTMTGRDGVTAHALDEAMLVEVLAKYHRGAGGVIR